jgi:hypothetical protein
MSKIAKVFIPFLLLLIGIFIGWQLNDFNDNFLPTVYEKKRFYSSSLSQEIFLKKKSFGMDGQIIVISTTYDDFDYPKNDEEYAMEGLYQIFYKFSKDTLFVYTSKKFEVPENFNSRIIVKQIIVDETKFMEMFNEVQNNVKIL